MRISMKERISSITTQSAEGLYTAQEKLSDIIHHYLADYANDLIWDSTIDVQWLNEPTQSEKLRPRKLWNEFFKGKKGIIPKKVLDELKHDTYIMLGNNLFYVEKSKNKVVEIKVNKEQLDKLKKYHQDGELNAQHISEVTGHTPNPRSIHELEDTDPLQVQFSKHALIALQESEELVRNLGKFSVEVTQYFTDEKQSTESEEKKLLELQTQTEQLSLAFENMAKPDAIPTEEPTSLISAGGKFVKAVGTSAIQFVPGLSTALKILKPYQETIILSILAPYSAPIAAYQEYINTKWYFEIYNQVIDKTLTARDFAIEKRDGILRPLLSLSMHCSEMYKIAEQANLPEEARHELDNVRKMMAELQAKTLLSPSGSQELLQTSLLSVNKKLSTIMATYFTKSNVLAIQEKKEAEIKENKNLPEKDKSLSMFDSSIEQIINGLEEDTLKHKINASLKNKDAEGYYVYLTNNQETPLSLNLKAISNTFFAIKKISQLNTADLNTELKLQLLKHFNNAVENFNRINIDELNSNLSEEDKRIIDAAMIECMKLVESGVMRMVEAAHDIELKNHLRYGSLLEGLSPLFEKIEDLFVDRGLAFKINPLGFNKEKEEILNKKKQLAAKNKKAGVDNRNAVIKLLDGLDWYIKWANEIPKQTSLRRRMGLYLGGNVKYDLSEQLQKNAVSLLKELHRLKKEEILSISPEAFSQFENRLIDDLSKTYQEKLFDELEDQNLYLELRKKLALKFTKKIEDKGIVSTLNQLTEEFNQANANLPEKLWPPKELTSIYDSVFNSIESLNDQLLDEVKYQDALKEHNKFRVRFLKKESLINLIEAVKEGIDSPEKNVREKKKLARLILDVMGNGEEKFDIKKAHNIVADFLSDDGNILTLIKKIIQIDSELKHPLIIEGTLAGYIKEFNIDDIETNNAENRKDLINMLERLKPGHVFKLINERGSQSPTKRSILFLQLLDKNALVHEQFNHHDFIKVLVDRYNRADLENDSEVKNKIGLFLGKFVNSKPDLMGEVYSLENAQIRDIIKKECFINNTDTARALYFEGVVSTLLFKLDATHKRSYEDFLNDNQSVIIGLHRAIHENDIDSDASVILNYKDNILSLVDLIDQVKEIQFLPGGSAQQNINEFHSFLIKYIPKSILQEQVRNISKNIKEIRERFANNFKHIFSDFANKNLLWDSEDNSQPKPISDNDKHFIKLAKSSILVLDNAQNISEKLSDLIGELSHKRQNAKKIAAHIFNMSQSINELMDRLEKMSTMTKEMAHDDKITENINSLKKDIETLLTRSPQDAGLFLSSVRDNLSQTMDDILKSYTNINRPAGPQLPEHKYEKEVKTVDQGVTAQDKVEWLFLLEPLRTGMSMSKFFHNAAEKYLEHQKKQGILISPDEEKTIVDTAKALNDTKPDSSGYFIYTEDETPFSQSLKALYNVAWAINEVPQGFKQHSGLAYVATATTKAGWHGSALFSHLSRIQFSKMSEHTSEFINIMTDNLLMHSKEKAFSLFAQKLKFEDMNELTQSLHDTELKNHLRFGILSQPIRELFYDLEKIFYERGLSAAPNPLSYDPGIEAKLKQKIIDNPEEKSHYEDALEEYKKIRSEFAIKYLKQEGIHALLKAVIAGKDDPKLNIDKKRLLAILIADINSTSREDALNNVNSYVQDFYADDNSQVIKNFIDKVYQREPRLGRAITIESMLAGYVDYSFESLVSDVNDQDAFIHVLDKLEAKTVLSMMDNKKEINRACVLFTLLQGNSLTLDHLQQEVKEIRSKSDLVNHLIERYKKLKETLEKNNINPESPDAIDKPERQLMNKLGLFLGRLALDDAEIAKNVFSKESTRNLLEYECIHAKTGGNLRIDSTLYYEAMVNAFSYKKEPKQQSVKAFISHNSPMILKIYRAIHSNLSEILSDEILKNLQKDPKSFLIDLETFIKMNVSKDSKAENQLRQFLSDFILCHDNVDIRYEIMKLKTEKYGSKHVRFLDLLLPDSFDSFLELARHDLSKKSKEISSNLTERMDNISKSLASLDEYDSNLFKDEFDLFELESKNELKKMIKNSKYDLSDTSFAQDALKKAKKIISSTNEVRTYKIQRIVQKQLDIEKSLEKQCVEWENRIAILARPNRDLESLTIYLERIVSILKRYQIERTLSSKSITGLRNKKISLANDYINQFEVLIGKVRQSSINHKDNSYNEHMESASALYEKLKNDHNNLMSLMLRYRSGEMGSSIKKIASILKPNSQFEKNISRIGNIIKRIKKSIQNIMPTALRSYESKGTPPSSIFNPQSARSPDKGFHKLANNKSKKSSKS